MYDAEWQEHIRKTSGKKVISHVMSGCSKRGAAKIFNIGEATVYNWLRLHRAGNLKPKNVLITLER